MATEKWIDKDLSVVLLSNKNSREAHDSFTRKHMIDVDAMIIFDEEDDPKTYLELSKDNYGKFVYLFKNNDLYLCVE